MPPDKGSYQYLTLGTDNDNFTGPGFGITVGGTKLTKDKFLVPGVEVVIQSDGSAGGCTFTIEGMYDYEKSKWLNNALDVVKPGAKIIINGGYVKQSKELFYGYVDDYSLEFSAEGIPRITVNGLDGLGFLMNMREPFYGGKKKPKEIITEVLNKSVSAGFAKSVTVGELSGFETPVIKEQIDDWKFLRMMSQRYGASFYVVDGEMIFDTVLANDSPILTLTIGKNIKQFTKRVSLAHQVGKVEVYGRDINEKPVKGASDKVTVGGSGKSAAELVPGLSNAVLREYNEYVRTDSECQQMAKNRLNTIAMGLISGEGACVGIPELIPGRYLKIDGGDEQINGSYFLTKVTHSIGTEGFHTSFEVKGAKL